MKKSVKNVLWGIFAVVMLVVCGVWFLLDDTEPIEDTNGADNYDLQVITDRDIINRDRGAVGGISIQDDLIGDGITISSDNCSGVYDVLYENYIGKSDFNLRLTDLTVTGGNFRALIIHNDEIVDELEFNSEDTAFIDYWLEDVTGSVHLRIAGESAAFSFRMFKRDYESFGHS